MRFESENVQEVTAVQIKGFERTLINKIDCRGNVIPYRSNRSPSQTSRCLRNLYWDTRLSAVILIL